MEMGGEETGVWRRKEMEGGIGKVKWDFLEDNFLM